VEKWTINQGRSFRLGGKIQNWDGIRGAKILFNEVPIKIKEKYKT